VDVSQRVRHRSLPVSERLRELAAEY
jgi:hypothetical protein